MNSFTKDSLVTIGLTCAGVIGTGLLIQTGTPYLTAFQAQRVITNGDQSEIKDYLKEHVDFDAVKNDLENHVTSYVMEELEKELRGNPFSGLAYAMMPKLVNDMVNTFVNPGLIARGLQNGAKAYNTNCEIDMKGFGKANLVCDNGITYNAKSDGLTWFITGVEITNFRYIIR